METQRVHAFARRWVAAWNSHNLAAILPEYAEDVQFASPLVESLFGVAGGVLRGREALRAYFAAGLTRFSDLHFELTGVYEGVGGVALRYRGVGGREVIEVMCLNEAGEIAEARVYYEPSPGAGQAPASE